MGYVKEFADFVNEGIIKKQSPDKSRADFLFKELEKSRVFLKRLINSLGINNESANSIIKLSYDIIMEILRAKMLVKGLNASGTGAHEAEVSFLRELGFSENEVQFANQLRYFRNGIMYYGKIFDEEYARKVLNFLEKVCNKIKGGDLKWLIK